MVSVSLECHMVMKPKRSSCYFSFMPGTRIVFYLDDHLAIELMLALTVGFKASLQCMSWEE